MRFNMSDNTNNLVTQATFINTASGDYVRDDFVPNRDRLGKIIYSTGLKAITLQVDRDFPAVLPAKKIKDIVVANEKAGKTILVEKDVDYRRTGKEFSFEEREGSPASKTVFYKPIMPQVTVSI